MALYIPMLVAVAVIFLSLAKIERAPLSKNGHSEPPLVRVSVWQLWTHGTQILDQLAAKHMDDFPDGIFTVSIFGWKIYVVNSPQLTLTIQARSKYTGLGWISVLVMASMAGQPKKATELLFRGVDRGDVGNGIGFVHDYHKVELRTMSLGNSLDAMRSDFATAWQPILESLRDSVNNGHANVNIWHWLRMSVTISVSRAVWGPTSPYCTKPELWEQFWTFNSGYNFLKYNFPRLFAWRGAIAREKVVDAFVEYDKQGGFEHASALAQSRKAALDKTGLGIREVARMSLPQSVGQFDNAATVSFAVLSFILRDPKLQTRIREELGPLTTTDHRGHPSIDISRVESECPLLLSTFHEVLRLIAVGVTVRRVEQDYPLEVKTGDNKTQYFLRKGSFIWSSGIAIHTSPNFYTNPEEFNPERFLGVRFPETQMPDIFRAFGGGGNICLGRHFARTIVPGAVASLLMCFDFEPVNGVPLCVPHRTDLLLGHATPNPFGNTKINLKTRVLA
ncbi:hypothetical protein ACJ73_04488 [Blastomyces percursus]|uniref:Cytochrome P450 n=1 Tax=Blastomyces percursus TaxID=1658174 RepID=A0A1J9Q6I1_9EURO|nr:hypothetical protein ACJ73_04488 [Blastomyces percursus]